MVDDIPNNVGKKGAFTWDETEHPYKVIKEIVKIKQDNPNVALCLQQIQLDDSTRLRFCYCNKKKGKWVVARTAPHMFPEEFQSIVLKAINDVAFPVPAGIIVFSGPNHAVFRPAAGPKFSASGSCPFIPCGPATKARA